MTIAVGVGAACGGDDDDDDDDGDGSRADARPSPDSGAADAAPDDAGGDGGGEIDAGPEVDAAPPGPALVWIHGDVVTNGREQLAAYQIGTAVPGTPVVTLPGKTGSLSVFQSINSGAYDVSLDGNRVALPADIEVPGRFDLYVATPDGSSVTRAVAMTAAADVAKARLSPDGQWIAFTADLETDGIFAAYVVPSDAVEAVPTLVSPAGATDDVDDLVWANNSQSLLFTGDFTAAGRFELFIVDVEDPTPTPLRLIGPDRIQAPAAQAGVLQPIQLRGGAVLFRGRLDADNAIRLYTVPASGSGNETVLPRSEILRDDESVANVGALGVSPNGNLIAFAADQQPRAVDLWVMPVDGSQAPTRLTPGLSPPKTGIINPDQQPLRWRPDNQAVAFFADYGTVEQNEPFVAPTDGSGHRRLADFQPDAPGTNASALGWSPDGSQLFMVADLVPGTTAALTVFSLYQLDPAVEDQEPVLVIAPPEGGDLRGDITISN